MDKILVLDFGGQYAHLITRRFRNLGYYSEISSPGFFPSNIDDIKGIVLSGGPSSVYSKDAPKFNRKYLDLNIPILGLCYGHQLLLKDYNGIVEKAKIGEYGFTILNKIKDSPIFNSVNFPTQVWMSHSDTVTNIPDNFEVIGSTGACKYAACQSLDLKRFTLQFHAEVKDTIAGDIFLKNFAKICKMEENWNEDKVIDLIKEKIIKDTKNKKILVFLSGGVDSSVTFYLLVQVLGKDRVLGLYINNGFMREKETEFIAERYKKFGFDNIIFEDAEEIFLKSVKNVIDPQIKRKIIGETFLKVRDNIIKRLNLKINEWLLAQGTLYPDIIESGGTKNSITIKTHHNRVKKIKHLLERGLIIEPLSDLYKNEVRFIAKKIGLPDEIINRHPFPGPGISINLICSNGKIINKTKYKKIQNELQSLDLSYFLNELNYILSLLPFKSVGVQGDYRTYNYPVNLKIQNILDTDINWDKMEELSSYITNSLKGINRVVFEIFMKKRCKYIKAYCTKDRLDMIRVVDSIVINELKKSDWYYKIFQHMTINIPFASNKDSCSIVLRPVVSENVMTARFAHMDLNILKRITEKIFKLEFVDALFYDITNKPPATFGWE